MTLYSRVLLRWTMVALFMWFGLQQLVSPSVWVSFLPDWTGYLPVPGEMLVQLNGLFEVIAAFLLFIGVYTRLSAAALGVHLLGIALAAGGAIGVRDTALGLATLSIALAEADEWTIDSKQKTSS